MIGAFGLHAYGRTRATQDLDFVTVVEAQSELVAHLQSIGYETLHISPGYSNHLHSDPSLGRVDFVYVGGETGRKLFAAVTGTLRLGDLTLPVPKPEHLIAMKVFAIKNDPGRKFQEMADIHFLMQLPGIDEREVRGYFEQHELMGIYDQLKKQE